MTEHPSYDSVLIRYCHVGWVH